MIKHPCRRICVSPRRAVGILRQRAVFPRVGGGREHGAPPPPQSLAAVLLREGPPHPRCHLGTRLLTAVSGPHQAVCSDLELTGYQR